MKKILSVVFLVVIIGMAMASAMLQAQDQPRGEIVIALPSDPTSLYLPRAADRTAGNASWPLYDSLVFLTVDGDLVPALAERWEINDEGTEYTFFLRRGVTFHNGEEFNAQAVVATWQFGSDESNDYAGQYSDVVDIEVIDDFTVKLITEAPNPLFLTLLADNWGIIPPAYMNEVGIDAFAQAPVGTGPFVFVERLPGDRIVYEANPNYWNAGQPRLSRVTFRVIPDSTTRVAALRNGEVDIINRLSSDEAALLAATSDNVTIISYPNDRVYYVAFKNVNNGIGTPIENQLVRRALNHAVNRPGIIQGIFGGEAELISGFTVSTNLGYDPSIEPFTYDPALARELLAEAGFPDGFEISMGCPTDAYPSINEVCLAIQRDLSAVGVEVSLEFRTSNTYWGQPQYAAVGPMFVDSWSSAVGEALPRLQGALTPGAYYTAWEDDVIVDFINRIASTVDRDERAALYAELSAYMFDNPPFIYLYQLNLFEAINNRVQGYQPRPAENFFLGEVFVTD